jgi:hypothetical protein
VGGGGRMTATGHPVGVTRRGRGTARGPLRHVWTSRRASRTGTCNLALCGRGGIRRMWPSVTFDTEDPRACRSCVAALADVVRRPA